MNHALTATVRAWGAQSAERPLEPLTITRRAPGAHDVVIDIDYCGICHSDIHQVRSEWAGTLYPCVPGHEIVGRVVATGQHVTVVYRSFCKFRFARSLLGGGEGA